MAMNKNQILCIFNEKVSFLTSPTWIWSMEEIIACSPVIVLSDLFDRCKDSFIGQIGMSPNDSLHYLRYVCYYVDLMGGIDCSYRF